MAQQEPLTNGDKPATSSQFLSHLTSYPVVSDGIDSFRAHPYGKKSLELADGVYSRFGKPVEPYLETPLSYAKPYAVKADELADSGLGHVEQRFPIVKSDTKTVVEQGKSLVWWPFKVAEDGKNYVLGTWNDEYEKTAKHKERGPGLSTSIMALISTELKLASDFFQVIADFLGPRYEESKQKGADYVQHARDSAHHYAAVGQDTAGQYVKAGQDKVNEYAKLGQDKAAEAQKVGQDKVDEAKTQAQKAKEKAQK